MISKLIHMLIRDNNRSRPWNFKLIKLCSVELPYLSLWPCLFLRNLYRFSNLGKFRKDEILLVFALTYQKFKIQKNFNPERRGVDGIIKAPGKWIYSYPYPSLSTIFIKFRKHLKISSRISTISARKKRSRPKFQIPKIAWSSSIFKRSLQRLFFLQFENLSPRKQWW